MRLKLKDLILLLISITCLATSTFADVQYIAGDHDAWFTAVGGEEIITTIDFTDLPNATRVTNQYADLGITFDGLNFTTGPVPATFHDGWGIHIFSGNDLYFDEPINWIAADFIGTFRFRLYDGEELFYTSPIFGTPPFKGFAGLISDRPFDHVFIWDPADFLAVVDDLHFGPLIAVPAPASLVALALPLIVRRRRRRRASPEPSMPKTGSPVI